MIFRRNAGVIFPIFIILFIFTFHDPGSAKAAQSFSMTIMHVNDTHSRVQQYPHLYTAVKSIRGQYPNTILVDAGDVFFGTNYFSKYQGKADLQFLNDLNYDVMTLGNHEFDYGTKVLADFIKELNFPLINSNFMSTNDAELGPLFQRNFTEKASGGKIYSVIVKEVNGEKIGFFGLLTPDDPFLSSIYNIESPVEIAQAAVEELNKHGINKIVILSHVGYDRDLELAEKVDGIDVIIGGHTHTVLNEPVLINKAEPTIIVQAGKYLEYMGLLNVTFDKDGVIEEHSGKLLTLNDYAPDQGAQTILSKINATPAQKPAKAGWVMENGRISYFVNGNRLTGRQTLADKSYYFGTDGFLKTEWQTLDGNRYYFDPATGILKTGLFDIAGKTYYFDEKGAIKTEWQKLGNKSYYFGDDGAMLTGWHKISDKNYYFSEEGVMATGWKKFSGNTHYFGEDGVMKTGWQTISDKTYYFGEDGIMVTGTQTIDGKKYKFNSTTGILKTETDSQNTNQTLSFNTIINWITEHLSKFFS